MNRFEYLNYVISVHFPTSRLNLMERVHRGGEVGGWVDEKENKAKLSPVLLGLGLSLAIIDQRYKVMEKPGLSSS